MDNRNEELFNGIIDTPNNNMPNNNIGIMDAVNNNMTNNNYENMEVLNNNMSNNNIGIMDAVNNNMSNNNYEKMEVSQPTNDNQNMDFQNNYVKDAQTIEAENQFDSSSMNSNLIYENNEQVGSLNNSTLENTTVNPDNKTNEELLKSLNEDTEALINPSMGISSIGQAINEKVEAVNIEEPKVDYEKIENRRKYIFMGIIFAIMLIFIIFLPKIVSLIGI